MTPCRTGSPIIFTSCGAAVMAVALVLGVASGAARSTEEAGELRPSAPRPEAAEAAYDQPARTTLRLEKADAGVL